MLLKWRKTAVRREEAGGRHQLPMMPIREERGQETSLGTEEANGLKEEKFHPLFAENPWPMIVFAIETFQILEVNEAAAVSYGYSREAFLLMRMTDLRSPHEIQRLAGSVVESEDTSQQTFLWRHWRRDGVFVDFEVIGQKINFAGCNAVLVVARDITERRRAEAELVRLTSAIHLTHTGMLLCDLDGTITDVNSALVDAYGAREKSEIIGKNAFTLLAPEERNRARKEMAIVGSGESLIEQEYFARTKTGMRIPVAISLALMKTQDEQPLGFVCTVTDVRKWKRAEKALRQREELFRQLAEHIDAVFWVMAPGSVEMLYVSPAYERVWGRSCASVYERPGSFIEAIHPDDRARVSLAIQQCIDRDEEEYCVVQPNGSTRLVRSRQFLVRNKKGEPQRLIGMAEDITERRQADEQLRYNEEQLRELTEHSNEAFWVMSADGKKVLYVSPAYEKIWGRTCAEVYDQQWSFADGIHPEDCVRVLPIMLENWATEGYDEEYRLLRPDGTIVWIRDRVFPVTNANGEVLRVVRISEDISLWKQDQEAKEDVSRQLIEAQEAERRHFARELHDEIGQMLTALKINLEAVLPEVSQKLESRLVDSINMVHGALQQVRNLCLDLRPSQLDDLGLAATLEWYVDRQAERTGLNIHLMINPFPRPDPVVETTCFRVVQEALTNIVRHAKARQVWIELRQQKALLELVMYDDGVGFNVAYARKRAVAGSSGGILGMEERVRLVGGTIEIVARPNRGVLIRASFPLGSFEERVTSSDSLGTASFTALTRTRTEIKQKPQTKRTGLSL